MSRTTLLGPLPLGVLWVLLALVAGGPVGTALDPRSTAVATLAALGAWVGWGAVLVALGVPRTPGLTVVRILVPAGAVAVAVAVADAPSVGAREVAAVALAVVVAAVALSPWVADAFVDGSSYGPERRTPLRLPLPLAALGTLTWALVMTGAVAGPALLAAGAWPAGVAATLVGWALAAAGSRSLHQLSRRWVVLVPTGLVLHDPLVMPDPQLFLRHGVARLGPAPATAPDGTVTEDLTGGASGLALELVLTEPVELLLRDGRRSASTRSATRVLFTPSLPGTLLAEARRRRYPGSG